LGNDIVYAGYVELDYDGSVKTVEIRKDETGYYTAWVDEELMDQIDGSDYDTFVSEFADDIGERFYDTMGDYREENERDISDVVPEP